MLNQKLFQLFQFKKPVEIEDMLPGYGDAIIASKNKTIIQIDPEAEKQDMPELLSKVKLAEIDPLLVTYFFQKDLTPEKWDMQGCLLI